MSRRCRPLDIAIEITVARSCGAIKITFREAGAREVCAIRCLCDFGEGLRRSSDVRWFHPTTTPFKVAHAVAHAVAETCKITDAVAEDIAADHVNGPGLSSADCGEGASCRIRSVWNPSSWHAAICLCPGFALQVALPVACPGLML